MWSTSKFDMLCRAPLYSPLYSAIFFFLHIYFEMDLYKYNRFLHFCIIPAAILLITSFFLFKTNYLRYAYSLKDSQNFFMQSLNLSF